MRTPKELEAIINGFKLIKDLGYIKNGTRYALFECKECKKEFKSQITIAKTRKSCGCILPYQFKKLPEFINGFKIIKDLGRSENKNMRIVLAECKSCKRHYKTEPYQLKNRESCNCKVAGTKVSKYVHEYPDLLHSLRRAKSRCYNINNKDYYNYGARGIEVCKEWLDDQDKFIEWAVSNNWEKNLSLDRIDNNKGYSPENCRWVLLSEQARNKRTNKMTLESAESVRKKYKLGVDVNELSKEYNTCKTNIRSIINNKTWIKI